MQVPQDGKRWCQRAQNVIFSLLLSSLELSDTKVYEPSIRYVSARGRKMLVVKRWKTGAGL